MTTATGNLRAWYPSYLASEGEGEELVELIADELLGRHPAEQVVQEFIGELSDAGRHEDSNRLGEAIHDLTSAAKMIAIVQGPVYAELGEPGINVGMEPYLQRLSELADVPHLVGRVESDGMFHLGPDGAVA